MAQSAQRTELAEAALQEKTKQLSDLQREYNLAMDEVKRFQSQWKSTQSASIAPASFPVPDASRNWHQLLSCILSKPNVFGDEVINVYSSLFCCLRSLQGLVRVIESKVSPGSGADRVVAFSDFTDAVSQFLDTPLTGSLLYSGSQ
jgi:hypothetical protein